MSSDVQYSSDTSSDSTDEEDYPYFWSNMMDSSRYLCKVEHCFCHFDSPAVRTKRLAQHIQYRNNPQIKSNPPRDFRSRPSPLRRVFEVRDDRFPRVETATEYHVSSPQALGRMALARVYSGLDDADMPHLLDLLSETKRFAATFLKEKEALKLSMLAMFVNIGILQAAIVDKTEQTSIVLDIVPCAETPGEEDIVFRKQIYRKGYAWIVRLRVGPEKVKKRTLSEHSADDAESSKGEEKEQEQEQGKKKKIKTN
jgi:hypothetical protein